MKKITALLLLCSIVTLGYGQNNNKSINNIYAEIGTGPVRSNGYYVGGAIHTQLKNEWSVSASYHEVNMNPKSLPKDYERGYTLIIVIPIPDIQPSIDMKIISITGGRSFKASRNIWFTTEAGLSYVSGEKATFKRQPVITDFFGKTSNYSYTTEKQSAMGAMLKADFNWAFLPFAGIGVGGFANFSSIQTPIGLELKLLIGKLPHTKRG